MKDTEELYIYLGEYIETETLFFLHFISSIPFDENISNNMFKRAIEVKLITSPNKRLIIFEIDSFGDAINKIVDIVVIQHKNTKTIVKEFEKESVEAVFTRLINEERNEIFVIGYNNKSKKYNTYLGDHMITIFTKAYIDIFKNDQKCTIRNSRYMLSVKSFDD